TLVAAALPAAAVIGIAYVLDGITSDGTSHATRVHDGIIFGLVVIAGALVAAALAWLPPPEPSATVRNAALAVLVVASIGVIAVGALHARTWWDQFTAPAQTELSNTPGRLV